MTESPGQRRSRLALAAVLATAGVLHFVVPSMYARIVPRVFPEAWSRPLVAVSGAAELVAAIGLLSPRTKRPAGWFAAALLVAVFPANVQMAVDSPTILSVLRLPLQAPLVWWAWRQTC